MIMHPGVKAAWIGGVLAVVAAVATPILTVELSNNQNSSSSPSSPAASSVRNRASGCTVKLRITSPADGIKISGAEGVLIEGKACNLANDDGWLFDFDYHDHYYHEDYSQ